MGYSIRGNQYDGSDDVAIEAKDCHLVYEADYLDQNRGISVIGSSATDLKDYRDFRDWERLAQKHGSSISMIEHNEIGGADPTETYFNASTGSLGLYMENVDGGSIRYFKANSGAELKPFTYDRPGANTNVFMTEHVLRHIFAGMEWPLELTWNTSLLGGPAARLVLAKAQRKIARRQAVIYKLWKRLITYAVAVGVKNSYISFDPDWYKWEPTYPSVMTIDNGRDTKAELELYKIGSNNLSKISGAGGDDWKEVILQKIREQKFITEECKKEGVDPSTIAATDKPKNPAVDPMKEQSDV
jgi:capsid protein